MLLLLAIGHVVGHVCNLHLHAWTDVYIVVMLESGQEGVLQDGGSGVLSRDSSHLVHCCAPPPLQVRLQVLSASAPRVHSLPTSLPLPFFFIDSCFPYDDFVLLVVLLVVLCTG